MVSIPPPGGSDVLPEIPLKLSNTGLDCPVPGSNPLEIAHQLDELAEQIMTVARPGRRLGMVLHREDWPILKGNAAI
jgi:hypothetical protein